MGLRQRKQPMRRKEATRPLLMVASKSPTTFTQSVTKDAPQSHAHPCIDGDKRRPTAMFAVRKPAAENSIEVLDDDRQAVPVRPARLLTHRVFELPQALLPRQPIAPLEVIAEEVKAPGVLQVHEVCFLGMQPQACRRRPALHERQRLLRVLCRATEDDEVSRPGELHPQALAEPYVNVSAHTAPSIRPPGRRPSWYQWANSLGSRPATPTSQCAARRRCRRRRLYFRMAQRTRRSLR